MKRVRDVHRLLTTKGRLLCSKSYPFPESEVHFIAKVMIHLAEAGFQYSPQIVSTSDQALWTKRKEKTYMITNWVRGRSPDFKERSEWKKAIRVLAAFHHHAECAALRDLAPGRDRFALLQNVIENYRTNLSKYQTKGDMSACVSLCDDAIRYLKQPESMEAVKREASVYAFVHGDYNYPNLIIDSHGNIHLIDFENTSLQARMTDLAHILHRNFAWKGDETLRWIEYYDRFRPLSHEDRHLLFALLHVPYPLVRAIRLNKCSQKINNAVPQIRKIDQYVNELKKIV